MWKPKTITLAQPLDGNPYIMTQLSRYIESKDHYTCKAITWEPFYYEQFVT